MSKTAITGTTNLNHCKLSKGNLQFFYNMPTGSSNEPTGTNFEHIRSLITACNVKTLNLQAQKLGLQAQNLSLQGQILGVSGSKFGGDRDKICGCRDKSAGCRGYAEGCQVVTY